jgi:sigma-E factor negative regulatory protein RseC
MQFETDNENPQGAGEMIEATAMVVAVEDGFAVLETQRTSACGGCGAAGACGTSVLGEILGRKPSQLRIANDFDACPGEQVIIGLAESDLMLASLAAYLLPVATMILAALAALGLGLSDTLTALAAFAGFGLGLLGARQLTRHQHDRFTPRFLRRAPYAFAAGSCRR